MEIIMETKRFKPKLDKLFWLLMIPTNVLCVGVLIAPAIASPQTLFITLPVLLFVNYFFFSSLFGYVELRETELFIRYGFILKKTIPYAKIRSAEKERKFYCESMMALKNSLEHVNIKYNTYDVTTVSVADNDTFIAELYIRTAADKRLQAL